MEHIFKQIKEESKVVSAAYRVDIQNPVGWCALIGQEVGKLHQSLLEDDLESDKGIQRYRLELVRVASASFAAIEALDRQRSASTARDSRQLEIQFPEQ